MEFAINPGAKLQRDLKTNKRARTALKLSRSSSPSVNRGGRLGWGASLAGDRGREASGAGWLPTSSGRDGRAEGLCGRVQGERCGHCCRVSRVFPCLTLPGLGREGCLGSAFFACSWLGLDIKAWSDEALTVLGVHSQGLSLAWAWNSRELAWPLSCWKG